MLFSEKMNRVFILLIICAGLLVGSTRMKAEERNVKVLQLNLWHGLSQVPGGYQGFIEMLDTIDADVVFLCEIKGGQEFIRQVIGEMKARHKDYYGETFDLPVGVLTKFKPDSVMKCCTVPGNEERTMVKLLVTVAGQQVAFYSCHLDHRHYECYLPRGYSGTTWKKIEQPVTEEQEILRANRLAYRDESVKAFLEEARKDCAAGRSVVIGGDFNEPSHLDWRADTRELWDHHGAVVRWDCSSMLHRAGFKDAYREKYSDPVRCPGFTFPAGNRQAELARPGSLSWAPEADERDRIDFIYYHASSPQAFSLKDCSLVGPEETVLRGEIVKTLSDDAFFTPAGIWPSDHKGNLAVFVVRKD